MFHVKHFGKVRSGKLTSLKTAAALQRVGLVKTDVLWSPGYFRPMWPGLDNGNGKFRNLTSGFPKGSPPRLCASNSRGEGFLVEISP